MPDPVRPLGPSAPQQPAASPQPARAGTRPKGPAFEAALEQAQGLRLSNHVQKRMQDRRIDLGDDGLARLAGAVDKAQRRGCKESLVLVDDLAFIVNVRERIVVTAIDPRTRGEGVFTQIDSVVLADRQADTGTTASAPTTGPLGGGPSASHQEASS